MVSKEKIWNLLIQKTNLGRIAKELREGKCSQPQDLRKLANEIGVSGYLKAPELISLDSLERLPQALVKHKLYVIRLGQHPDSRAKFVLCKASENYRREIIKVEDIKNHKHFIEISTRDIPKWALSLALNASGEALASCFAILFLKKMEEARIFTLPSVRLGSVRFSFKPTRVSRNYTYWGQVEIDTVLGSNKIFALEAKGKGVKTLFKHKIAFSALALAQVVGKPVYPLVAFISERKKELEVNVALLAPRIDPSNKTYVIEDLCLKTTTTVRIPVSLQS